MFRRSRPIIAALAEPDSPRLAVDLAKLPMLQRRYAQADGLLQVPPKKIRQRPEIRNLPAHAGFIRMARDAPPIEQLEQAVAADPERVVA